MAEFLKANVDVFAQQPSDMLGIEAEVMCHKLHINKNFKLVKQKPRRTVPEKAKAAEEEIKKLLEAGAIREAQFSE